MKARLTRRRFIQSLLILPIAAAVAAVGTRLGSRLLRAPARQWPQRAAGASVGDDELKNIAALAEVLIPPDETPGADPTWVRDHVERKIAGAAGYGEEYRRAAHLLDRLAASTGLRGAFWSLPWETRDGVIRRNFPAGGMLDESLFQIQTMTSLGREKARLWEFVARDLIEAFYASDAGWAAVGYTHYPGKAADERDYMAPVRIRG